MTTIEVLIKNYNNKQVENLFAFNRKETKKEIIIKQIFLHLKHDNGEIYDDDELMEIATSIYDNDYIFDNGEDEYFIKTLALLN